MNILEHIDFILFPPRCPFCNDVLPMKYGRNGNIYGDRYPFKCFCDKCAGIIDIRKLVTNISGMAVCYSPLEYTKAAKRAVLYLKKEGYRDSALQLARIIVTTFNEHADFGSYNVVTYVPATRTKMRKRGFNQTEEIAKYVSKLTGAPCKKLLKTTRKIRSQHTLSVSDRKENVKDAYKAVDDLKGMRVILVDDIITTGSTLKSCSSALKAGGAESVCCVTVCKSIMR